MAHGGSALGRDKQNRIVFVPGGIPGETIDVELSSQKKSTYGRIKSIVQKSKDRVAPSTKTGHGPHGGYSYEHIKYNAQLKYKKEVVIDQLKRIGGFKKAKVNEVKGSQERWAYEMDVTLSPTNDGRFGFWSPQDQSVLPIEKGNAYKTLVPALQNLLDDFDWNLPDLRKLTLRAGSDGELLVALEVQDVEPPELHVDFPISVTIVLPDRTTANLIGINEVKRQLNGRWFQISAGCPFYSNLPAAESLIQSVLLYLKRSGAKTVIELHSGVGGLTAFLAENVEQLHGIEPYPAAVADAAVNLEHTDNVYLYEGFPEDILPILEITADTWVMSPAASGLASPIFDDIAKQLPSHLIYVSSDIATMARDGKILKKIGYRLVEVQPHDLLPQTFHVHTVSLWSRK